MKKHYKKIAAIFFALVISLSFCGCAEDDDFIKPTKEFFVNDFANIISKENEQKIIAQGAALQEKTKAQAVVVTVNNLEDRPIEEYALQIGRKWGIGDEDEDNGIVVLLSKEEREIYIAVGYGLEGALPDSKVGRIIDQYGSEHIKADDFSTGVAKVYESVVNEIYIEYGFEVTEGYTPILELPTVEEQETASAGEVLLSWIALIVIVILYIAIFGRRGGLFIFGAPRFFGGFHHHGGFGGFHGGSSGGFGGFKGGGGSFGGGGAGRKF